MGVLSDNRHELFCQGLAAGKTRSQAYIDAGYSPNGASSNAIKMSDLPEVKARTEELLSRAATRAELKASDIQEMLLQDRTLARNLGQPSAAIRAAELLGKVLGMFAEKREIKVGLLDEFSPEQLEQILEATVTESIGSASEGGGEDEIGE